MPLCYCVIIYGYVSGSQNISYCEADVLLISLMSIYKQYAFVRQFKCLACCLYLGDYNVFQNCSGTTTASGSSSWLKKADAGSCRSNCVPSRSVTEDVSLAVIDGITSVSTMSMSEYEGKQIQRKMGKAPKNGNVSFKKPRMLQPDNLLPQTEADEAKTESEKLGLHLVRCSSAGEVFCYVLVIIM